MLLVCLSSRGVVYDLSGSGASERWTSDNKYYATFSCGTDRRKERQVWVCEVALVIK